MKLTCEQSQKLLREHGVWTTEACDKCGKLLGSVRWTRRGEPGEWCASECRDGVAEKPKSVRRARIGSQSSGRPRKHENDAAKMRAYRIGLKSGSALRNTPLELAENTYVAGAKNRPYEAVGLAATEALKSPLIAKSVLNATAENMLLER